MSSSRSNHRRNHTTPNAIPLQDLHRPPELEEEVEIVNERAHRRTLSERGRALFSRSPGLSGGGSSGRYGLLGEEGAVRSHQSRQEHLAPTQPAWSSSARDDDELSPLAGAGAFTRSTPSGLFRHQSSSQSPTASRGLRIQIGREDSLSSVSIDYDEDDEGASFSNDADTLPLTDARYLQPMASTAPPSTPPGQRQASFERDRSSPLTRPSVSAARLGDDLAALEAGTGSRPRPRGYSNSSLSPSPIGSPLQRASTMMRKMSQRVVNLSNEPEIMRHDLHPRPSQSSDRPATIPELAEPPTRFSADERAPSFEKASMDVLEVPTTQEWSLPKTALRGKSLGLFSPDSKIRTRLCEFLVHPWTEPAILLLILLQTVLLAVDSGQSVFTDPRSERWGTSWVDYALICIFVIYTAEIVMHVIVSGFVVNPVEYSTINRGAGLWKALKDKAATLFSLHGDISTHAGKNAWNAEYSEMLRNFEASSDRDAKQGLQRLHLAYRAFLRHSFNRLDFLAVVSFWISFILGLAGLESKYHLWVFRMLSCLRILRLLNITSGTAVSTLRSRSPTH